MENPTNTTEQKVAILDAYIEYSLSGKHIENVYQFCKEYNLSEKEFYDEYGSLKAVKFAVYKKPMHEALQLLHEDENFKQYSTHEKVLALYFTWVQQLTNIRSFLLFNEEKDGIKFYKDFYYSFYNDFKEFTEGVIAEGISKDEIPARQYIDQLYSKGLWSQLMFIFKFWLHDESKGFERTDAAIEKSAKVAFDMIGHGPLDSIFDLGRFMMGNMRS